ncbi:MAG: site-specific integrase [Verrucomicrobiota bacterium]|nr:site-specific integrase [Verrucomicrobiota bacterium]
MQAKRDRFPIVIKRGSCSVKIYRDQKKTGTYYRVAYHIGGKRERLHFADLEKAKLEAESQAAKLSRGDVDAMQLTGKDRLLYGRAVEAVRGTGVSLDAAALEYSEAWKHLHGVSLVDAAKFYARHHGRGIKRMPVAEVVREMIAAKEIQGVSVVYLNDLRYRLGAFAERFQCDLAALSRDDVRGFLDGLKLSARSFNNYLTSLKTFFGFAADRDWLSREADLLASVKRRKEKKSPVEIFTPSEMATLLQQAGPDLALCLALGAFAGLRSEEILRLEWADVIRRPGFIEVAAHKAKTAARRLVPITTNLEHWLNSSHSNEGLIWTHPKETYFKSRLRVANEAGIRYKANALRHSWITYRLAEVQNVNQVALEAGNSPQMIFNCYRELATPTQALSWFAILPGAASNVVQMRSRAV